MSEEAPEDMRTAAALLRTREVSSTSYQVTERAWAWHWG
jgi:hypothetical protein